MKNDAKQNDIRIKINSEKFLNEADELIDKLIEKASLKDKAEFIPACLYFTGTLTFSEEYDTFKALHQFHDDIYNLVGLSDFPGNSKIRLMMMYYCHIIESDAFYTFLYNLASIANGQPNVVEPFKKDYPPDRVIAQKLKIICSTADETKKVKKFQSLTKELLPTSITQKIQMTQKLLKKTSLTKLSSMLESLYSKDIRNVFAHNKYNVYGGSILLFSDSPIEMPIQEFVQLFMNTTNFYALLCDKTAQIKHEFVDGTKHEYSGAYGKFSIQFMKEDGNTGRFHIKSTKKTSSI